MWDRSRWWWRWWWGIVSVTVWSILGNDNVDIILGINFTIRCDIIFVKKSHLGADSSDTTSIVGNYTNNNKSEEDDDEGNTDINNSNHNNTNNNNEEYEDVDKVKGRYVMVHITEANGSILKGEIIAFTTLQYFYQLKLWWL